MGRRWKPWEATINPAFPLLTHTQEGKQDRVTGQSNWMQQALVMSNALLTWRVQRNRHAQARGKARVELLWAHLLLPKIKSTSPRLNPAVGTCGIRCEGTAEWKKNKSATPCIWEGRLLPLTAYLWDIITEASSYRMCRWSSYIAAMGSPDSTDRLSAQPQRLLPLPHAGRQKIRSKNCHTWEELPWMCSCPGASHPLLGLTCSLSPARGGIKSFHHRVFVSAALCWRQQSPFYVCCLRAWWGCWKHTLRGENGFGKGTVGYLKTPGYSWSMHSLFLSVGVALYLHHT